MMSTDFCILGGSQEAEPGGPSYRSGAHDDHDPQSQTLLEQHLPHGTFRVTLGVISRRSAQMSSRGETPRQRRSCQLLQREFWPRSCARIQHAALIRSPG
jgi:hypothetical protein